MDYVKIRKGFLKGDPVIDQIFPLVRPIKDGQKGLYIVVDGRGKEGFPESDLRIHVPDEESVVSITAQEAITGIPPVEETDEQILAKINARFSTLEQMTEAVASGQIYALVVSGPGGVGKSFGVKKVLKSMNEQRLLLRKTTSLVGVFGDIPTEEVELPAENNYQIISGYMRAPGVYKALYDFKERCQVTIFDDCDFIMEDETSLNILKTALDTQEERHINYGSETNALAGYERDFIYRGGTIFITNKKFDNIREKDSMAEHLQAIMTRCHYLDLTLDDSRSKFLRIKQVIKTHGMLRSQGFSEEDEDIVLAFISTNKEELRDLSLRMALKIANLIRIDRPNWKEIAKQTCMRR
jgi:hypothetical protein